MKLKPRAREMTSFVVVVADSSVLMPELFWILAFEPSAKTNVLSMASNEVLILHVDASKNSDDDCLCTGENRAATRLRKERKDKASTSGPEISIVSVEKAKSKRKKFKNCPNSSKKCVSGTVTLLLSSGDEDETEMMEIDSKADKGTSSTSNRIQTDSLSSCSRPSTSSGSSSVGKQRAGTSKSTADDDDATSSVRNKQQLESDYLAALRLDQALNSKPLSKNGGGDKDDVITSDAALAKTLQEKEYCILKPKRDVLFVMESRVAMPRPSSPPSSSSNSLTSSSEVIHPNEVIPTPLKVIESQQKVNPLQRKHPTCWTECPLCPADAVRKYHLIEVMRGSAEWDVVAQPVVLAGFIVTRMRRIQNEALWQRLCFEKQLMLRERSDVNEKFLYHTTRSEISVICEEGLDQRLSRSMGNFGNGIYFRYKY